MAHSSDQDYERGRVLRRDEEQHVTSSRDDRDYEQRHVERPYGDEAQTQDGPMHFNELRAWEVMHRDVTTVGPGDAITLAARLMAECDCGALPVVNREGEFAGMITDRDITVRAVARGADPRRVRVDECMTHETICCHADDLLEECLRQMAHHQIRRLPVVDDHNHVIGIISQADIARHVGEHQGRGERRAFADTISEISEPSARAHR